MCKAIPPLYLLTVDGENHLLSPNRGRLEMEMGKLLEENSGRECEISLDAIPVTQFLEQNPNRRDGEDAKKLT